MGSRDLVLLLEEQWRLARRLRLLAERQRELVLEPDVQPFLRVLSERQNVVNAFSTLSERLAPFREQWTTTYCGLDQPARRRVAELLEEVNSTLGDILHDDLQESPNLKSEGRIGGAVNAIAHMEAGIRRAVPTSTHA